MWFLVRNMIWQNRRTSSNRGLGHRRWRPEGAVVLVNVWIREALEFLLAPLPWND